MAFWGELIETNNEVQVFLDFLHLDVSGVNILEKSVVTMTFCTVKEGRAGKLDFDDAYTRHNTAYYSSNALF